MPRSMEQDSILAAKEVMPHKAMEEHAMVQKGRELCTIELGTPNERQEEFFKAQTRFVAYGGGRGGGKSWAVQRKAILLAANYDGIRILILRRTMPELRENHILPMRMLLRDAAVYSANDRAFTFPNGSRILFGYCDSESDVLRYQGQEFDSIFIDEATQFTRFQFETLTACLRGANGFPKRFYLTCNPGGVGHEWVRRLFIDRRYENSEKAEDYTFIKALAADNPALIENDPGYMDMLKNLPSEIRRAWLDGDWDVFAGQYFKEFRRDVHVIKPFPIPPNWRIYRTIDYGLDMLACYWIAVDEKMNAYVFKELHEPNLIIAKAAQRINAMTKEKVFLTLAPPDMWNRRQETGKSVADIFSQHGIELIRTGGDRVSGWLSMLEWLAVYEGEDGSKNSAMRIFENCENLIRDIPRLRHDERDPNDVSINPHIYTHGPDAIRGFCTMWPMRAGSVVQEDIPEYSGFINYGV